MTDKTYRAAFEQAKADLAGIEEKRAKAVRLAAEASEEAIQLRRAVTALAALCGENIEDSMGLTAAVRLFFQRTKGWHSLRSIKEQVEALGVGLSDLKNADASVLSVLGRLVTAKELQTGSTTIKNATGAKTAVKIWAPAKPTFAEPMTDDDIPF